MRFGRKPGDSRREPYAWHGRTVIIVQTAIGSAEITDQKRAYDSSTARSAGTNQYLPGTTVIIFSERIVSKIDS